MSSALGVLDRPASIPVDELVAFVERLVATPAEWAPLVADAREERQFRLYLRDDLIEAWVVSWGSEQDTGFHDHGGSDAAVAVAVGAVVEERLRLTGLPLVRRLVPNGSAVHVPPTHVHRVRTMPGTGAVTVHAYSPPLSAMGVYAVREDGILERTPVAGDTALEPTRPDGGPCTA